MAKMSAAAAEAKSCMSHDTTETLQPTLTQNTGTQSVSVTQGRLRTSPSLTTALTVREEAHRSPSQAARPLTSPHPSVLSHPSESSLRCSNTHGPGGGRTSPPPAPGFPGWSAFRNPTLTAIHSAKQAWGYVCSLFRNDPRWPLQMRASLSRSAQRGTGKRRSRWQSFLAEIWARGQKDRKRSKWRSRAPKASGKGRSDRARKRRPARGWRSRQEFEGGFCGYRVGEEASPGGTRPEVLKKGLWSSSFPRPCVYVCVLAGVKGVRPGCDPENPGGVLDVSTWMWKFINLSILCVRVCIYTYIGYIHVQVCVSLYWNAHYTLNVTGAYHYIYVLELKLLR